MINGSELLKSVGIRSIGLRGSGTGTAEILTLSWILTIAFFWMSLSSKAISQMAKEILMDFHRNPEMSEDVERRKTTFIVRKDLLERAEKLGLLGRNLSFFVEMFLEKFLDAYESFLENWTILTPGVGFEPTNPYGQGISSPPQWPGSATPARNYIR